MTTLNTDVLRTISSGQCTHITVHKVKKESDKKIFWRQFFSELDKQKALKKMTLENPKEEFCKKIATALIATNSLETIELHKTTSKATKQIAKIHFSSHISNLEINELSKDAIKELSPLLHPDASLSTLTVKGINRKAIKVLLPILEGSSIEKLHLVGLKPEDAELFTPLLSRSRKIDQFSTSEIAESFLEKLLVDLKERPLFISGEYTRKLSKKIGVFNQTVSYPMLQVTVDIPSPTSPYKAPKGVQVQIRVSKRAREEEPQQPERALKRQRFGDKTS